MSQIRTSSFVAALAVGVALAGSPAVAHAQDDPRMAKADAIYQEGLKLHDKDREGEALEKFKQAYGVYPSPNILFSQARAEQLLGKNIDAAEHYRKAMKDAALRPKNAENGKKYLAEVEAKIAKLTITGPAGARVVIRGAEMKLPLATPVEVDPGTVTVMASLDGKAYEGSVDAQAGQTANLELKASGGPAVLPPVDHPADPVTPPPKETESKSFWGVRSYVGVSLVALGAVGFGAGFVFKGTQSDEQSKVDELGGKLPDGACAGASQPAECGDLRDAADNRDAAKNRATVAFVAGGVFAVAGIGLLVSAAVAPHKSTSTGRLRIVPAVGQRDAGLLLQSTF